MKYIEYCVCLFSIKSSGFPRKAVFVRHTEKAVVYFKFCSDGRHHSILAYERALNQQSEMQSGGTTLGPAQVSHVSDCQVVSSQNGDSFPEVKPVNLVAYGRRILQNGNIDVLYYPTNTASYSGYVQNSDSPTKSNCPIDLAMSTPRGQSNNTGDLRRSADTVNVAAFGHKQPAYTAPANHSVNETSTLSVRNSGDGNNSLASLPNSALQTVSTDIKYNVTSSSLAQPATCQNAAALIHSSMPVSSSPAQQMSGYPHGIVTTCSVPSSCQSAQWQPVLSPRTSAELMATAVRNASSQALCPDSAMKEGERNPLLLQLQVRFAL